MLPNNNQGKNFNYDIAEFISNDLPLININPGPYDYKLFFENNYYPHSVNLTKLVFRIKHQGTYFRKIIFLTSGHSFADNIYMSNFGCSIKKTTNINDLFFSLDNLFYSIDNDFNDFCLISFGSYNIDKTNNLNFMNKTLSIISIYRNINIKNLENEILIKKGHNTGESFAKAIIDFSYDNYIHTVNNKKNYYTFKINGKIVIILSPYASGIVIKGCESKITHYNGNPIDLYTQNTHLEYHFLNSLSVFKDHDLFNGYYLDDSVKNLFNKYVINNSLTISSLMGDSGTGFYKVSSNNNIEFIGINICSCHMIVLNKHSKNNNNKNIYYDSDFNKLVLGQYYIDEIHKTSQILPLETIEKYIKNLPNNIIDDITV
jgi:hypothetical protein